MIDKNVFDSDEEIMRNDKPIIDIPWQEKHKIDELVVDNPTQTDYKKMPVTQFGMNMLQRMGWSEGRGIGKNTQNALLQPVEIIPRHHRLGLGAEPAPSKYKRKGNDIKGMVSKSGRGYKYLDEKAVTRESLGIQINSEVVVIAGKHKGLEAIILQIKGDTKGERICKIELKINDEAITVDEIQIVMKKYYKNNEDNENSSSSSNSNSKLKPSILSDDSSQNDKKPVIKDLDDIQRSRSKQKQNKLKWVAEGLCVKIKSQTFQSGKYYNKKCKIHDILDKYSFLAIDMKGQEILEGLEESDLKISVPNIGQKVYIIKGQHKGLSGILKYRDKQQKIVRVHLTEFPDDLVEKKTKEICEFTP